MEQEQKMKKCAHCGRTLPQTSFYKNKKSSDGLQSYCKECAKASSRKTYQKSHVGAGKSLPFKDPRLSGFTPRDLMRELKARGYTGKLQYVQHIDMEKL